MFRKKIPAVLDLMALDAAVNKVVEAHWDQEKILLIKDSIRNRKWRLANVGVVIGVEPDPRPGLSCIRWGRHGSRLQATLPLKSKVHFVDPSGEAVSTQSLDKLSSEDLIRFSAGHFWVLDSETFAAECSFRFSEADMSALESAQEAAGWKEAFEVTLKDLYKENLQPYVYGPFYPEVVRNPEFGAAGNFVGRDDVNAGGFEPIEDAENIEIYNLKGKLLWAKTWGEVTTQELKRYGIGHFWYGVDPKD